MQDRGAGFAFGGGCAHGRRRGSLRRRAGLKINCNAEDGTQHVLHICKILSWVLCLGVAVRKVGLEQELLTSCLGFAFGDCCPQRGQTGRQGQVMPKGCPRSWAEKLAKRLGRGPGQEAWPRGWPRSWPRGCPRSWAKRSAKRGLAKGWPRGLAMRLGHEAGQEAWPRGRPRGLTKTLPKKLGQEFGQEAWP